MATFHYGKIYLLDHGIKTDLKGEKFVTMVLNENEHVYITQKKKICK